MWSIILYILVSPIVILAAIVSFAFVYAFITTIFKGIRKMFKTKK